MASCNYEPWLLKDLAMALKGMQKDNKEIVVPMFQRGKRWKSEQEDTFIDSLKDGLPIGTMLFYKRVENNKETYILIDGLQRGNTIKKYMMNPMSYFSQDIIPDNTIDQIYKSLNIKGSAETTKQIIRDIFVKVMQGFKNRNRIQSYPFAREITSAVPTTTSNIIDEIIKIIDPFLDAYQDNFNEIANTTIPVIVYTGDEENLPKIFKRINSQGTPLTTYEVYAASWPINNRVRINNDTIVEKVLKKYDALGDDDYKWHGYSREKMRVEKKLNAFEYVFGFSKYLNNNFDILNFTKKSIDDEIDPMGFELINACINESNSNIKTLYKELHNIDINLFEIRIIESIEFVSKVISSINKFKGNKRKANKILHSKYQMISMISSTFREKYDISNLETNKRTWRRSKEELKKNMLHHYIYDIIKNEWNEGGIGKIHSINKSNKYLSKIPKTAWESLLNSWFENKLLKKESSKVANPSKEDFVFLNVIYLKAFTARDQISSDKFDIEHLATKEKMKKLIKSCGGEGLPISSIGNLCYLPESINRGKKDKTFYQDINYTAKVDIDEIESKYSFTDRIDLEWMELPYQKSDFEELKKDYYDFLVMRFEKQKEKFYDELLY